MPGKVVPKSQHLDQLLHKDVKESTRTDQSEIEIIVSYWFSNDPSYLNASMSLNSLYYN